MSLSIAVGSSVVSASTAITSLVRTHGRAKVCAPALEPVLRGGRITVMPARRPTSPVPSVEPSSTRMISSGGIVCVSRLRIVSPTNSASLYAGMITVNPMSEREELENPLVIRVNTQIIGTGFHRSTSTRNFFVQARHTHTWLAHGVSAERQLPGRENGVVGSPYRITWRRPFSLPDPSLSGTRAEHPQ